MPLRKQRPFFEPEVTSFADIAFLLIIFFILTTTFVVPAGQKLDIPAASADPA
ncbi:MAG: biopolymer transporter ExbD, partial [Planctomycetes bacterium]|nr:biopolymer transporter ExbD [Planctomycetota bacterium]